MLQRFINIADEQARWEAEEKERQRLEQAESRRRASEGDGGEGPPERPLMIRTGKAKTEGGWPSCWLVISRVWLTKD